MALLRIRQPPVLATSGILPGEQEIVEAEARRRAALLTPRGGTSPLVSFLASSMARPAAGGVGFPGGGRPGTNVPLAARLAGPRVAGALGSGIGGALGGLLGSSAVTGAITALQTGSPKAGAITAATKFGLGAAAKRGLPIGPITAGGIAGAVGALATGHGPEEALQAGIVSGAQSGLAAGVNAVAGLGAWNPIGAGVAFGLGKLLTLPGKSAWSAHRQRLNDYVKHHDTWKLLPRDLPRLRLRNPVNIYLTFGREALDRFSRALWGSDDAAKWATAFVWGHETAHGEDAGKPYTQGTAKGTVPERILNIAQSFDAGLWHAAKDGRMVDRDMAMEYARAIGRQMMRSLDERGRYNPRSAADDLKVYDAYKLALDKLNLYTRGNKSKNNIPQELHDKIDRGLREIFHVPDDHQAPRWVPYETEGGARRFVVEGSEEWERLRKERRLL